MKGHKGMTGGLQKMLKQASQMQSKMKKIQEELNIKEYSGQSGGNAVAVTVTGEYLIKNLSIDKESFKEMDLDMLQDLIVTATNSAIKEAKKDSETQLGAMTGGMNIPGLF